MGYRAAGSLCAWLQSAASSVRKSLVSHRSSTHRVVAVYILVFAYPILAVRLIEAFSCQEVEGKRYLRADYAVSCDSAEWFSYAVFAGICIFVYVAGFPLFLLYKLGIVYPRKLREGKRSIRGGHLFSLHFLLDDFIPMRVPMMWEFFELMRKLLLSSVGAIFGSKSVASVAIACIISVGFQLVHAHYWPYKTRASNRLQAICLATLSLIYFVGACMGASRSV
jgi:hypothetical protein